ncbi:MAG: fibronectin type III domain-containing protein, partial [Solirubrobacteraceae bacterium]|nr:fibronectin type III domain-containing protein [Solirubrobacteraceae bacterium]
MSRVLPRLALACAAIVLAFGGAVAPATAATTVTDQDFTCKYPLLGIEPSDVKWTVSAPDMIEDDFTIDLDVDFVGVGSGFQDLPLEGLSSVDGTLDADLLLKYPSGQAVDLKTKIPLRSSALPSGNLFAFSGDYSLFLNGLGEFGRGTLEVQRAQLNLTARQADGTPITLVPLTKGLDGEPVTPSDADPSTFDAYCRQAVGQSPTIAALAFGPIGDPCWILGNCPRPQAPSKPTVTSITESSARVQWSPPSDPSVESYVVEVEGLSAPRQTGSNSVVLNGLEPATTYTGTVRSVSRDQSAPDSDPVPFTFSTQDPSLRNMPRPFGVYAGDYTQTTAIVRWALPENPVLGFRIVSPEGQRDEPTTVTELTLRGLQPSTEYEVRVQSLLLDGVSYSAPLVIKFRTAAPPLVNPGSYSVTGSAEIPTLVRGSMPLKGSASLTYSRAGINYAVEGTLALGQTTSRLVALSFLPVTAKIAFVSSGQATGINGGFANSLWLTQKVRIKVLEAKLFGAIPLAAGNNCQTKQLTDLNLSSGYGWPRAKGGLLTGTFKISDL